MMRREGDRVVIEISADQFNTLVMALGHASAVALPGTDAQHNLIRLANEINAGNTNWRPYIIPSERNPADK